VVRSLLLPDYFHDLPRFLDLWISSFLSYLHRSAFACRRGAIRGAIRRRRGAIRHRHGGIHLQCLLRVISHRGAIPIRHLRGISHRQEMPLEVTRVTRETRNRTH
jgi:hypothetical protein